METPIFFEILLTAIVSAIIGALIYSYKIKQKDSVEIRLRRKHALDKYREFISVAAYELQSRIYNILAQSFLKFAEEPTKARILIM